jgi:hypothetical protein
MGEANKILVGEGFARKWKSVRIVMCGGVSVGLFIPVSSSAAFGSNTHICILSLDLHNSNIFAIQFLANASPSL